MTRHSDTTRRRLLETAFQAFHEHGYQSAGLSDILSAAGVTKGALYHHFDTKKALGLAVVEEVIRPWMTEAWIEPLARPGDPIDQLRGCLRDALARADDRALRLGCPLANIAQEMAPLDEDFRERIESILADWRAAIASALRRGQAEGHVHEALDVQSAAAMLVAAFEGGIGLVKSARTLSLARVVVRGIDEYLEHLRAARVQGPARASPGHRLKRTRRSRTRRTS